MEQNFRKFIGKIMLTEIQNDDAKTKYNGVCSELHTAYYPGTKYDGSSKILFGSYGKSTNIRPPRDIDVLFKMPSGQFEKYKDSGQSQLLQDIRGILKEKYPSTEKIKAFGKVVVINFSEGTHSVELLPAWKLEDGRYKIPNTENGGSWEIFDPASEIKHVSDSNKRTGKTLDMIRMLKKWAENCSAEIKSVLLEHLVINYLDSIGNTAQTKNYPQLMHGLFEFLLSSVNSTVSLHPGESVNLGDSWKSRAETAVSRAEKALVFETENNLLDASREWKKVFGDDFPKSEEEKAERMDIVSLQNKYPSATEEFLEKDYGIQTKLNPLFSVTIDAEVEQDGFRNSLLSSFIARNYPLLKKKSLLFRITKIAVPPPYRIMWKVRNFGEEANRAEDLRGQITEDTGGLNKQEHTKYQGEHHVECYIIKDGECVAVDRILVPIGKEY